VTIARSVSCAEKSAEWQKRFVSDQVNSEICGLLFVYNHDGEYEKQFKQLLRDSKPKIDDLPKKSKLFVLGPEDIFWLNNVRYEIVQMRGKGILPARQHCRFYYPNLVRRNNVQPEHARAATLEMDVLQLSELQAGDVKESRNDSPTRGLQMAADRTRPHILCGPVVSSLFFVAARC
jgi:hypothetical protein